MESKIDAEKIELTDLLRKIREGEPVAGTEGANCRAPQGYALTPLFHNCVAEYLKVFEVTPGFVVRNTSSRVTLKKNYELTCML